MHQCLSQIQCNTVRKFITRTYSQASVFYLEFSSFTVFLFFYFLKSLLSILAAYLRNKLYIKHESEARADGKTRQLGHAQQERVMNNYIREGGLCFRRCLPV